MQDQSPSGLSDQQLQIMLTEYEAARDDDRSTTSAVMALASVAVALLGGTVAVLVQDCISQEGAPGCWPVDDRIYAALPLGPFILMAYGLSLGVTNSVRSYYLRLLERALSNESVQLQAVRVPASIHISSELTRPRGSGHILKFLIHGSWTVLFLILLGVTIVSVGRISLPSARTIIAVGYGAGLALMLRVAYVGAFKAYSIWERLRLDLSEAFGRKLVDRPAVLGRLTLSSVLLPRPGDTIKWFFVPTGAFFGVLLWGSGDVDIGLLTLAFLGFEILLYQARYLYNDVHGALRDKWHPPLAGRPDYTNENNARLGVLNMVVRTLLALVVALIVWLGWGRSAGVALFAAYGAAITVTAVYEILRTKTADRHDLMDRPEPLVWLLYVWVGLGYAIRLALGAALAASGITGFDLALVALTGSTFGTMFVTMTWTLQSTKFRNPDRGQKPYPSNLRTKAHFMPLLVIAAELHQEQLADGADHGPKGRQHPEAGCAPLAAVPIRSFDDVPETLDAQSTPLANSSSFKHPWNLSLLASLSLTGLVGASILGMTPRFGGAALAAGALAGVLAVRLPRMSAIVSAIVLVFSLASFWIGFLEPALSILPAAAVAAVYTTFRGSSAAALESSPKQVLGAALGAFDKSLARLTRLIQTERTD